MTYCKYHQNFSITLRSDILEDPDIQILDITQEGQGRQRTTTIINVYNDPSLKGACILKRLLDLELPNDHPLIITGDFNLHHILWSASPVGHDKTTEEIVDKLYERGFSLLNNKGEITHPARHAGERDSVIDLSFVNQTALMEDTFKDWSIDPELSLDSDHYAIRFVIDPDRPVIQNPTGIKFSLKETKPEDWITAFETELKRHSRTLTPLTRHDLLTNPEQLDIVVKTLTQAIQNATSKTGKRYRPSTHSKPWWDEELSSIAKEIGELRREEAEERFCRMEFNPWLRERIHKLRNRFHRLCRKKKRKWVDETLEKATGDDIWKFRMWSKGSRNYPTPPIRRPNLPPAVSHEDKCQALRDTLYQPPPELPTLFTPDLTSPVTNQLPLPEITEEEIEDAIYKNSTNTAPDDQKNI
ncbi:hypothetical protein CVT24_007444 [Panaeolus cyanescens]|uniref:Endonuclease/exonuclease/phosphatase domain-containing protein n=1 Tax=Panaeolus cyanescens TaxID=181874 RepID=A0A409W4U4_9AGAR|nr:hypothetical protein CVT24_007444 [Panaeolus cyanescens]